MKITRFTFCILLTAIIWTAGCATQKPTPDPLAGWKTLSIPEEDKLNMEIADDYGDYFQTLPHREKYCVTEKKMWFLEDGTGRHAVKIEIPLNETYYEHVLIYDKDNKRIKVIKYASRYAS